MSDFPASMPAAYTRSFRAEEVTEHARIVARRGAQLAHAEPCGKSGLVCVVADDRPGLLALVTDALSVYGLGIRSARAYCRARPDGRTEAVDFLELQPAAAGSTTAFELDADELRAFVQTLTELIADDIRAGSRAGSLAARGAARTRVYFEHEARRRGEYVLLVEAPDASGLLHAVTSALHAHGARILSCHIGTEAGFARDRFDIAGIDGEPLTDAELCDIQLGVLAALPSGRTQQR